MRENRSILSLPPLDFWSGVNPSETANCRPDLKRSGSVTEAASAPRRYDPYAGDRREPASRPRIMLTSWVRCLTSRSRARCNASAACCSGDFTGTNRIVGRATASQIASVSLASVLPRLGMASHKQAAQAARCGQAGSVRAPSNATCRMPRCRRDTLAAS